MRLIQEKTTKKKRTDRQRLKRGILSFWNILKPKP